MQLCILHDIYKYSRTVFTDLQAIKNPATFVTGFLV